MIKITYQQKTKIYDVETGYDKVSDLYGKYHKHLNSFDDLKFIRYVPRDLGDKIIVDLGAGDGRIYSLLKSKNPKKWIACDISKNLLEKHPNGKNIEKKICNLEQGINLDDESIDLFLAFFVLEHIKNIEKLIKNVYDKLKYGGNFIVGHFHQRKAYTFEIGKEKFKIERFNYLDKDLITYFENVGFLVESHSIKEGNMILGNIFVLNKN